MLDKQPYGKGYEEKNWYHSGSPLFSRKEGRVPRYDRASAPAAFLSLPYEGSRIYSWVDLGPMILVRSVHLKLVSIIFLLYEHIMF